MKSLGLIVLFPLMGSIFAYLIGKKARPLAGWVATGASVAAFGVVYKLFSALPPSEVYEYRVLDWLHVGNLNVGLLLTFDALSAVMCLVVTGVGSLIHFYSIGYMAEDEHTPRFFAYLNLFMFSMLMLVLGGNLPVLFVGWEGVGLCSYLLIGFWFKNTAYAAAGRKAFVVNRIGDAGFLVGMFLLFQLFGTLDFAALKGAIAQAGIDHALFYEIIAVCLFIGAAGKSAQIPLFVWLPDAMAGPTPVSALIHAATMVTAGVYMMARMHFLFDLAPYALAIVCFVALLTAFVAATTALTQFDIKKVLAYSTVSQLGFMFLAVSVGAYWVAIFHVITHAFFKACLFLGAGSVIHGCHHEQDMRHMGGLLKKMPVTAATYGISVLAIAGIAPLSGYFSKHAILNSLEHSHNHFLMPYIDWIVLGANVTAFLTAFYMTRSFAMTFLGKYRGHAHPHESEWKISGPLVVLAGLAAIGAFWPAGHLSEYLSHVLSLHDVHHHAESPVELLLHSWIGILGVVLGLVFYTKLVDIPAKIYRASSFVGRALSAKYYFDEIYAFMIVRPLEGLARILWKGVDQNVIDATVNGTASFVDVNGEILRVTQTGQIRHYALFMFIATVVVIAFYLVM